MYRANCIDFSDADIPTKFSILRPLTRSSMLKKNLDYYVYMPIIPINTCSNVSEIHLK